MVHQIQTNNECVAVPGPGLAELLRQYVQLGKLARAANPDRRSLTLIASLWQAASAWTTSTRCALAGWVLKCWA